MKQLLRDGHKTILGDTNKLKISKVCVEQYHHAPQAKEHQPWQPTLMSLCGELLYHHPPIE